MICMWGSKIKSKYESDLVLIPVIREGFPALSAKRLMPVVV